MRKTVCTFLLPFALSFSSLAQGPAPAEHPVIAVNVLGAVKNPSHLTLSSGATILDALASAGSVTDLGNLQQVMVLHKTAAEKPDLTTVNVKKILDGTANNFVLQDGDTVNVPGKTYNVSF